METEKSLSDPPPPIQRKKRNQPGMPDPEAEVVVLSPRTLTATNRFVCEICSKGFQRDQNLQLHRRGHNLPWKLKQRALTQHQPPRRRVYVCPEAACVHHDPARALGDLTGIKKHFYRKHGEKKFKCERCSKKYAVRSDWKAHVKTCGTREYRCDCGTLFSRKDSFVTHRAFCDALAQESARGIQTVKDITGGGTVVVGSSTPATTPSVTVVSSGLSVQSSELADNAIGISPRTQTSTSTATSTLTSAASSADMVFTNVYLAAAASVEVAVSPQAPLPLPVSFTNIICSDRAATMPTPVTIEPMPSLSLSPSLYLSENGTAALFQDCEPHHQQHLSPTNAAMSSTALLQKAMQMGAASLNPSLLRGLGLQSSTSSSSIHQWDLKPDAGTLAARLGLPSREVMMGSCSSMFGNRPTLDFLGLGMGPNSALLSSYGGGFTVGAANTTTQCPQDFWDGVLTERNQDGPNSQ